MKSVNELLFEAAVLEGAIKQSQEMVNEMQRFLVRKASELSSVTDKIQRHPDLANGKDVAKRFRETVERVRAKAE